MVRKRASWLVILFVSEMLTATAMGFYEGKIARAVDLAIFVPLIISSGGNTGSQAATLIIRALALGELKLGDWWRVLRRELASGLLLGLILGSIGLLRITIWRTVFHAYQPDWRAARGDGRRRPRGDRAVGDHLGVDAPVRPEAPGPRPRHFLRPVRGHPDGCDRFDHLFYRGCGDHEDLEDRFLLPS